ncbi:MAG: nickel-dependent lactate racemase [bacterium]
MKIKIPYGNNFQSLSISEERLLSVIHPQNVRIKDESESITQAINNPLGCNPLSQFISKIKKVLIIVNDGTRPTPTEKIIDSMYDIIKDKDIFFLIATGTHRAPTKKELKKIFGKYYRKVSKKILIHNAVNCEMIKAGVTEQGTEVWYNKVIYNYDRIISTSSVEPHYFAGFTGGRKSFLPGISSFKSTEMNHKLALDPKTEVLKLSGNPVHEDMHQALGFLDTKKIFSIQAVLNREDKIYFIAAGDIKQSFDSAVDNVADVYTVPIKEKADIIVAIVTPPMDINLYQSHKAMQHARLALKPDGIIILVSPCSDGMGNTVFSSLLRLSETQDQILKNAEKNFILGTQTAVKFAELSKTAQLWGVTDIDPKVIRSIFMKPFKTLQQAVEAAITLKPGGKVLVLMNATLTVPFISNQS